LLFPNENHPPALGGFEVLERLGVGGMGHVYLARSRGGRLVAIKVLSDMGTPDAETSAALAHEASLCVRLSHPAIVQLRAFVDEGGVAALVFDYVEGVALGRLLRLLVERQARLPDASGWHVVERILSALAYAHQQKPAIVHRDISPANVLLDWSGDAKLTDFGMAKMLGVSPATRLGLVKGTMGCMAPEQARGEDVTERVDVYAVALLAWRLATGIAPFAKYRSDETEMLRAMRHPKIPKLAEVRPDLPKHVLDAIACALEPSVARRTISAEEFRKVIAGSMDLSLARVELSSLLAGVRRDLMRGVSRADIGPLDGEPSSGARVTDQTARYEDVALAFDDAADAVTMSATPASIPAMAIAPSVPPPTPLPPLGMTEVAVPQEVTQPALRRTSFPSPDDAAMEAPSPGKPRRVLTVVLLVLVVLGSVVLGYLLGLAIH